MSLSPKTLTTGRGKILDLHGDAVMNTRKASSAFPAGYMVKDNVCTEVILCTGQYCL